MPSGLEQFQQVVFENQDLQRRLREAPGLRSFLSLMLQLGREHGCEFSIEDIQHQAEANRKMWMGRWK